MVKKTDLTVLLENLDYLKLPFIRDNHESIAKEAAINKLSHIDFLKELIEGESALRFERAIQRRLRNAKFPYLKTLEQYQWTYPREVNRPQIDNLFRLRFIEDKENILFLGSCGVGKTHLSIALAQKACRNGYSVLFTGAIDIINTLSTAKVMHNLDHALKKYLSVQLLLIDELGYLPIDNQGANLLFQVISKRYERGSILLTSNRAFKDWPEIFNNDSTITSAILDRLLHHSQVVIIDGKSYRMKDKES